MLPKIAIARWPLLYFLVGSALLLALGAGAAGARGGFGVVILLIALCFSIYALEFVAIFIRQAGGKVAAQSGTVLALTMIILKLPVALVGLWLGWMLLGGAWLPFFGVIGLVYSATVWNHVAAQGHNRAP